MKSAADRKKLLQHIAGLATDADAIGDIDGGIDQSRVFLPLDSHRLALRPETVVVEGSRGAGKTALFHLINALGSRNGRFFEDLSIPSATWIDAFSESTHHPSIQVLDQLVASIDPSNDAPLRVFWAVHLVNRLRDSEFDAARLPPELDAKYHEAPRDPLSWIGVASRHLAGVMSALDAVDASLVGTSQPFVFASYDHLDRLGLLEQTRTTRRRLVRSLLALWLSLSTRYRNLRGKIFLRPDLFEEAERSFADASKLRPRSVSLEWDTASLYRLVARHLANRGSSITQMRAWLATAGVDLVPHPAGDDFGVLPGPFPEHIQLSFAKALAGDVMGRGPKKGYTYRWIPARLKDAGGRIVPRSFLRLFAHAARAALPVPPGKGPLMVPEHLVAALMKTSIDRVNELSQEYPFVSRLANLRGQIVLMARADVVELLAKPAGDDDGFGSDGDSVFEELLRIGVMEVRSDGRIDVPDIYRYGNGIKRKGGAAAPR